MVAFQKKSQHVQLSTSPQSVPLFDSHAHLDMLIQRGLNLDDIMNSALEIGLKGIIAVACADKEGEYADGLAAAAEYPNIWRIAGVHPHSASIVSDGAVEQLRVALLQSKAIGLGEIGLDYHYNYSSPQAQRSAFIAQLKLARELRLPVVVHTRNADDDTFAILDGEGVSEYGGVIHCFSSGEKFASQALEMGLYLSFSGIVTFPKSTEIQEVAKWIPEERILNETDSPFLSPAPKRGGINTPEKVRFVTQKIAELRNVPLTEMAAAIYKNTQRCFNLSLENMSNEKE